MQAEMILEDIDREQAGRLPVLAVDAGFGTWRTPADAPSATLLLIAWGSKASGPMAYDIGEKRRGKWITDAGQYIETQGYCVCAWMPLPALPNIEDDRRRSP